MEISAHVIHLPLTLLLPGLGAPILGIFLTFLAIRKSRSKQSADNTAGEKDWSVSGIDAHAHLHSIFHSWDPRIKIVSLLIYIFCVAFITRPLPACAALLLGIGAVLAARIPLGRPARRLAAMGSFLGMLLIVMPLTVPTRAGDTLVIFGGLSFLSFNLRGFFLAAVICLKASSIALVMEPLLGTSPFSVTMQALARLGVPNQVCQMILLAHRYIFVFHHEAQRMTTGMEVRGFRKKTDVETLRTLGNFIGMLLVRSFERTQRVYEAMLCRGYKGTMPGRALFSAGRRDWMKGAFWVVMGVGLVGVDYLM